MITPNEEYIRGVASYSATSAIVGDILGRTLNTYPKEDREYIISKWITKSRGDFPARIKEEKRDSFYSASTASLLAILEVLSVYSFTKPEEFEVFKDEAQDYL